MDNKINKAEQNMTAFLLFFELFPLDIRNRRFQTADSTPSTANSAQLSLNPKR